MLSAAVDHTGNLALSRNFAIFKLNLKIANMISRHLASTLKSRAARYPVVTVTGPRQSGKTTLCRECFPEKPYSNLERPDTREFALSDPAGYLSQFSQGAVLDEIQRVPELLS